MKKIRWFFLGLGMAILLTAVAQAAKTPAEAVRGKVKVSKAFPLAVMRNYDWPGNAQIPALKSKIQKMERRSLASDYAVSDTDLSVPLKQNIRTTFLGITTADGLDAEIKLLNSQYESLPLDAQYLAAQLSLLRPFRGIVYKMTKLATSTHVTDSYAYLGVTEVATLMKVFLPTDQWQSVFDYLVAPDPASNEQFEGMSFVQDYLVQKVLPEMDLAAQRLSDIGKKMGETPFYFDNMFLYGTANFQDNVDVYNYRYKMVGPAEIASCLASLHLGMHDLLVFSSYDMENYLEVKHSLGRLLGVDGFVLGNMSALVASNRVRKIREFPAFLKLRGDATKIQAQGWYGRAHMSLALGQLGKAVDNLKLAWGVVQAEKDFDMANQYAMLHPVRILPWSRAIELRVKTLDAMVSGKAPVTNFVTGEVVTVNLPNYYNNPPNDLKDFLPTGFEPAVDSRKKIYFRDYFYGRPTEWDLSKFAPYVSIPKTAQSSYIQTVTRVMAQSWAGLEVTAPWIKIVE